MTVADAVTWLAHGLGLGHVPLVPGTAGAFAGVALALGLARLRWRPRLLATLVLTGLALPICEYGSRPGARDDRRIVADELLTFPLATLVLPVRHNPGLLGGVFVASRVLDAVKPPPARAAERLGGGIGIVLDDVVSNLYALGLGLVGHFGYRRWRRRRTDT